jgi:YVTN family beta-propeller protein
MTKRIFKFILLSVLALTACEEPKPAITGRLSGPADLEVFKGCPQSVPGCEQTTQAKHLLLLANSLADDLKIFEVEGRAFFKAANPLFPLSIPVGRYPCSLVLDPHEEFAFVVNALSEDVSVVNLAPNRLVEVDTDWDSCTSFCGPCRDADDQPISYANARCRAGVSRVALGTAQGVQPEDIVTLSRTGAERDPEQPLPVYVSLAGVGQIAVLNFTYPEVHPGNHQRMELVGLIDVDGQPSGLALTEDGATLFAADEASDSVIVIDTATMLPEDRIPVGGPTRRIFLSPDDSVLYAIRIDDGRISLIDVAMRMKRSPGDVRVDAKDPRGGDENDFRLSGVPRSLTFSQGVPIFIFDDVGVVREYTTELHTKAELEEIRLQDPDYEETVVKTFAYVSDLNGNVYIIDAENHRIVDIYPFAGPSTSSAPIFAVDGNAVVLEEWDKCYPQIAESEVTHTVDEPQEREIDGELWRIYHGVWVKPGATRNESWLIEWEGILPGTGVSTSGRFAGWRLEDDRYGLSFIDKSKVRPGDILEIVVDPTFTDDSAGDHPCRPRSGEDEAEKVQYEFVVRAVEDNALDLEPVEGMDPEVCWAEALRYSVHAGDAWIVWGSDSGFMDRLTMVENTGEAPDPPVYGNGRIALSMYAPPAVNPDTQEPCPRLKRGMAWGFNSEDGFTRASFSPRIQAGLSGSLVSIDLDDDLEAGNPGDDRIFMLLEGSNAMIEFFPGSLDPSNYIIYQ